MYNTLEKLNINNYIADYFNNTFMISSYFVYSTKEYLKLGNDLCILKPKRKVQMAST